MFSKLASSQRSSEFTRKLMQSQVTLQSFPTRKFWKPFLTANWFWILEMKIRGSKMLWIKPAELLYARRSKLSLLSSTARKAHCILDCCTDDSFGSCNPKSTYVFRNLYRVHNHRVKCVVPAEKLLIYNVKQGWKPLCDFLGCEVPTISFLHENIKGELAYKALEMTRSGCHINREMQRGVLLICSVLIIIAATFMASCYYQ